MQLEHAHNRDRMASSTWSRTVKPELREVIEAIPKEETIKEDEIKTVRVFLGGIFVGNTEQ